MRTKGKRYINLKLERTIQNWRPNTKMAQAIVLPGAWGKIPVFMGKNHLTPLAAMAFLHAQNYPPARLKKFLKIFAEKY